MARSHEETRRTGQVRTGGRAALVVERVLAATLVELGRAGYQAMRVEDVAERSGVNKTTIYRRWPTKAQLVATVMTAAAARRPVIDTGTLRGDLLASLIVAFKLNKSAQVILRVVQTERSVPELDAIVRRFRDELQAEREAMVRRGIARGELPQGVDVKLVVELVSAPMQRALLFGESVDERFIQRVLDVVLAGAAANAKARGQRARKTRLGRRDAKTPKKKSGS